MVSLAACLKHALALVLLGWGARTVLPSRASRQERRRRKGSAPRVRIVHPRATHEYQPATPRWLVAAAAASERGVANFYVTACPALKQFEELVASGGFVAPEFGKPCREELFLLNTYVLYLNHGSYGAALRLPLEVQAWNRWLLEQQPVVFMEAQAVQGLCQSVLAVSRLVGCTYKDLVPVTNATTAINAVLGSLDLRRGDALLITSITYPAIKSTAVRVAARHGARVVEVQLGLEALSSHEGIIAAFQEGLRVGGRRTRLAILDHVVSFPPVVLPVRELAALCHAAGALALVDGAHAVGSLRGLDVPAIGADFYTSNLHKWLNCPKGAAFLWTHPSQQGWVRPTVTSHGYGLGYWGEFLWQGTADNTAWLSVPASLAVMQALGMDAIMGHNQRLARDVASLLSRAWGVKRILGLTDVPTERTSMVAVELPGSGGGDAATARTAALLHDLLRERHNIEVPVACWEGRLWVRISAQMYNTLSEYEALAEAVLEVQRTGHIVGGRGGGGGKANGSRRL